MHCIQSDFIMHFVKTGFIRSLFFGQILLIEQSILLPKSIPKILLPLRLLYQIENVIFSRFQTSYLWSNFQSVQMIIHLSLTKYANYGRQIAEQYISHSQARKFTLRLQQDLFDLMHHERCSYDNFCDQS